MIDEAPTEVHYDTEKNEAVFTYHDGHKRTVDTSSDEGHATALALAHRMGIHF